MRDQPEQGFAPITETSPSALAKAPTDGVCGGLCANPSSWHTAATLTLLHDIDISSRVFLVGRRDSAVEKKKSMVPKKSVELEIHWFALSAKHTRNDQGVTSCMYEVRSAVSSLMASTVLPKQTVTWFPSRIIFQLKSRISVLTCLTRHEDGGWRRSQPSGADEY
ncbi:hypothetical protein TWF217_007377 [Orbilia oligospora]|nr:hypothetical protein TWF217_007377 [Orbilia oligospora]